MADKYAKLGHLLKGVPAPITLLIGEVVSVSGEKCAVKVAGFTHEDVYLRLTDGAPATEKILVTPKVGSFVLVADLSGGENRALTVIDVETPEQIDYAKNGFKIVLKDNLKVTKGLLNVEIDTGVKVKAGLFEVEVANDGIKIASATANLKPLILNLQQHLAACCTALGLANGTSQMISDITSLQTLLK